MADEKTPLKEERAHWQCQCGQVKATSSLTPLGRLLCTCDDCRLAIEYPLQLPGKKSAKMEDYVDAYGSVDTVAFYKDQVKIGQGLPKIKGYRIKPKSGMVRFFASCCNTPLCFSHMQAPSMGVLAANFSPEDSARLGKPSVRIMTKFALKTPPSDPPPERGFGWGLICLVMKFICCGCLYSKQRAGNPIPYPPPTEIPLISHDEDTKKGAKKVS
mmetsp:Transcript_9948/g.13850  ORF Transcript_9948/g.13850 Transcript_9948/m.13850 type:complete len:215 (-) Transcript_9948:202-846(-)|eukprot:CAMPEP_0184493916 /NCGR_PEP_ID=MMETSP0113_2-20130426/27311_1 /TAXON_ID=91329 /ORGANISM="Norrisiella sphaerica, Strain BC52" /LENGTH=214 /DNA_ID=CAMNT_0026879405 /DNA_START=1 /DNA_END=645 /DNA_ORIENTATION=-